MDKSIEGTLNGRPITVMPQCLTAKFAKLLWIVEHDSGDSYYISEKYDGLCLPMSEQTFKFVEGNCFA